MQSPLMLLIALQDIDMMIQEARDPEQALARSQKAMAAARAEGGANGQACSLAYYASLLYLLRSDEDPARAGAMAEHTEQCYRLCLEHGLSMWRVLAEALLGWVMVTRGAVLSEACVRSAPCTRCLA